MHPHRLLVGWAQDGPWRGGRSGAGVAKPDPAVFALLCRALGVDPHECALVDDTPANTSAAALGMTTHLYRTPDALATFLAGLT